MGAAAAAIQCPEPLGEGVYTFDPASGSWVPGDPEAEAKVYVFLNAICTTACRRVMSMLSGQVGDLALRGLVRIVLVVCTRFRYVCSHPQAKRMFSSYQIIGSPSVAVVYHGRELTVAKGWMRVEEELPKALAELRRRLARLQEARNPPLQQRRGA